MSNNGNNENKKNENDVTVLCGEFDFVQTRKLGTILAAECRRSCDEEVIFVTPWKENRITEKGFYPFYEPKKDAKRSLTELYGPIYYVRIVNFKTKRIAMGSENIDVYESSNFIPHCFLKKKENSMLLRCSEKENMCLLWIKNIAKRIAVAEFLKMVISDKKWKSFSVNADKEIITIKALNLKPETFFENIKWAMGCFGILCKTKV